MRVSVLRSFPHSCDGVTILKAVAGAEEEIADALAPGLLEAGFIAIGEPGSLVVRKPSPSRLARTQ